MITIHVKQVLHNLKKITFATCLALCIFEWRLQTASWWMIIGLCHFLKAARLPWAVIYTSWLIQMTPISWKAWLFLSKQIIPCWDVLIRHGLFSNFQRNGFFFSPNSQNDSKHYEEQMNRDQSGSANTSNCWSAETLVFWQGMLWLWWNECMCSCIYIQCFKLIFLKVHRSNRGVWMLQ